MLTLWRGMRGKELDCFKLVQKILPPEVEVPSSFEAVGHIAHYNLRPQHEPYKHAIGQVCIDKNPCIKTVVTKVKEIENEFRVFDMEVIAGAHFSTVVTA
jgi:tRNA (guanine37-N1)-methyltransferase